MSIATWSKKHYPTPAAKVKKADAPKHDLRKWEGLSLPILKEHGLFRIGSSIEDAEGIWLDINASSCALCLNYYDRSTPAEPCHTCPLAIARGGVSCCDARPDEAYSPYNRWGERWNPRPMIRWLKKAAKVKA